MPSLLFLIRKLLINIVLTLSYEEPELLQCTIFTVKAQVLFLQCHVFWDSTQTQVLFQEKLRLYGGTELICHT